MFVWSTDSILSEMERTVPQHVVQLSRAVDALDTPAWPARLAAALESLRAAGVFDHIVEAVQAAVRRGRELGN